MELPLTLSILLILILLYASAWISSAETALFSLSAHKLKTYETDPDARKQLIASLLARPRDLLVTVFMINTFVNIILQNITSDMFGHTAGWGLKVGLPLILTLIFGEIIPKYVGMQNNAAFSYRVAPTINKLQHALSKFRKAIIALTTPISKILFFFLKKESPISKEELQHVIKTSESQGILDARQAELLNGFLKLQDMQVKDIMWPKEDIIYYELSQPLSKLIHLFVEKECTRVPVCRNNVENVVGVMTAMQFFKNQHSINFPQDLIPFLQKPFFVPESTPAKTLLKRMDEANHILAFAVSEYGSITGLISREDLVEVVIGDIEEDKDHEPLFIAAGESEVISSGKWELAEFNEHFSVNFTSPNHMVTIGGWLTEKLGEIPKAGQTFDLDGFQFQVLSSNLTRITRLFIKKKGASS